MSRVVPRLLHSYSKTSLWLRDHSSLRGGCDQQLQPLTRLCSWCRPLMLCIPPPNKSHLESRARDNGAGLEQPKEVCLCGLLQEVLNIAQQRHSSPTPVASHLTVAARSCPEARDRTRLHLITAP